jgi:hypothetical protein
MSSSSETLVLIRATWRNIPEDTILHSYRRENLKSYRKNVSQITFIIMNLTINTNIKPYYNNSVVSYVPVNDPDMDQNR